MKIEDIGVYEIHEGTIKPKTTLAIVIRCYFTISLNFPLFCCSVCRSDLVQFGSHDHATWQTWSSQSAETEVTAATAVETNRTRATPRYDAAKLL